MEQTTVTPEKALEQLIAVLREGFEGPQTSWSYFTDDGPEAGWFGMLDRLSAEEASRPSGPNGTSIAAHVHHMVFSLSASTDFIMDRWQPRDWSESWKVSTVDEEQWRELRDRLRAGYEALLDAFRQRALVDERSFGGALSAVAHAAYHLGAVKQKLAR